MKIKVTERGQLVHEFNISNKIVEFLENLRQARKNSLPANAPKDTPETLKEANVGAVIERIIIDTYVQALQSRPDLAPAVIKNKIKTANEAIAADIALEIAAVEGEVANPTA